MTTDFEAKRVLNTKPTLAIEAYAGKYSDPLYGDVEITVSGGQLVVVINDFVKATLDHWHYDTFRGWYEKKWNDKANASFILGADGTVSRVNFDGIEFKKSK